MAAVSEAERFEFDPIGHWEPVKVSSSTGYVFSPRNPGDRAYSVVLDHLQSTNLPFVSSSEEAVAIVQAREDQGSSSGGSRFEGQKRFGSSDEAEWVL